MLFGSSCLTRACMPDVPYLRVMSGSWTLNSGGDDDNNNNNELL